MKKLYFILFALSGLVMGCDPLDETYDELDEQGSAPSSVQVVDIALTDDDYEYLDEEFGVGGFGTLSEDEAKQFVPNLLDRSLSHLGNGSNTTVTYDQYRGGSDLVSPYTSAEFYEVSEDDYYSASTDTGDAGFFNNQVTSNDNVPAILKANIADPTDGQIAAVNYEYASINYEDITGEVIFGEDFEALSDLSDFVTTSLVGEQEWQVYSSSSGYKAANMSGYAGSNVPNEDWFVLPQVDLTGYSEAELKVNQVLNFLGDGVIGTDIAIQISTDFDGTDVEGASWENLEFDVLPTGTDYDAVLSTASLADYADEQVYIGFYYKSTADFAPNWRVISVSVEQGEAIETISYNRFLAYDDESESWKSVGDDAYYLSSADYDAMGAPGQFDNFSSSAPASDYLPQLLNNKYPFAQEEQSIVMIYKYYSSSAGETQTRGDLYTFLNGMWTAYQSTIESTLQFGKEGGVWVPDNTIRYTLQSGDYSAIAANPDLGTAGGRTNLGDFGNFSLSAWSTDDIYASVGFVLKTNFPSAAIGQKYLVTYNTYPAGDREVHLILNEEGNYVLVE